MENKIKSKEYVTRNIMITYQEFERIINEVRDYHDLEVEINNKMSDISQKYNNEASFMYFSLYDTMLNFLAKVMDDKDEWIDYFCWERDFGRDSKLGVVRDADGKPIPFTTIRDLWDMLTDNSTSDILYLMEK